jgi:predicted aspartyl protease
LLKYNLALLLVLVATSVASQPSLQTLINMTDRGASTFYVDVRLAGIGLQQFLVDTGSTYSTINERTLDRLRERDQAEYLRDLEGVLADGSKHIVPLYSIKSLSIGDACTLNEVQAAVFPGETRNILGLNVLRTAAPFTFSVDPPTLSLSNCDSGQLPTPLTPVAASGQD